MAGIDTSDLLFDPDFMDFVYLIRRVSAVNSKGVNELIETLLPKNVLMSVHNGAGNFLKRLPDSARLTKSINVYYHGTLIDATTTNYCDVIIWRNQRYLVSVVDSFENWGAGYCHALCTLENANG